jgi:ribosomal protein S18 acetylase RimI-like enzyme
MGSINSEGRQFLDEGVDDSQMQLNAVREELAATHAENPPSKLRRAWIGWSLVWFYTLEVMPYDDAFRSRVSLRQQGHRKT